MEDSVLIESNDDGELSCEYFVQIGAYANKKYALEAEKMLFSLGVSCEVINIHTIKPIDEEIILESIKKTKCAISCEEHNIIGGLGESISRLISEKYPIPFKVIGVNDSFGESGKPLDLLEKYNLNPESIKEAALEVIDKK